MKKIISLILLSVLMLMTCSCEVATPTVEPTSATTEALNSTPTVLPSTTPFLTTTTTPSAEPTKTPTPTLEDTLPHPTEELYVQGIADILSTGCFDTPKIEICTNDAGEKYLSLNVLISKEESNYNENFGNSEYYTWRLIYHDADKAVEDITDLIGYYTVNPVACEERENNHNLYRLKISDLPEGDFMRNLKEGKVYMFLITLVGKDGDVAFIYASFTFTKELAEIRDNFYASNI